MNDGWGFPPLPPPAFWVNGSRSRLSFVTEGPCSFSTLDELTAVRPRPSRLARLDAWTSQHATHVMLAATGAWLAVLALYRLGCWVFR